ncbi:MAG: ferrous iron transport protein A, partial [Deltaproteobacteria bacterium]|nr:ferrous iron transport protein A [Deltaproteobacteria bacterium]
LGLRIGKKIQLLQKRNQGPLLIKVGDSRIVVGREMAENIFIKIKNSVLS